MDNIFSEQPGFIVEALEQTAIKTATDQEVEALTRTASGLISQRHVPAGATAVAMLRRAIALAPDNPDPWAELGVAFHSLGRFPEAIKALEKAIALDPGHNNARSNLALVNGILGNYDEAEQVMRELCEIPERRIAERIHLALMLLAKGDWERGMELYEQRVGVVAKEFRLPKLGVPYWQGEDIADKTLYIQTEQGIGDTICFSRYIAWVKKTFPTARIKLNCHGAYGNLLWEFRHLVEFVPSGVLWPGGDEKFDYGVYLHSIAYVARTTLSSVFLDPGYIHKRVRMQYEASPLEIPKPNDRNARKIGLVWTGSAENYTQVRRSVPLELLLYLATEPRNVLYSLQCGVGKADLDRIGAHCLVEDLSGAIEHDLVICGVAMMELDAVVTCCTSVAHLAGAIGVPCFLMLCHDPYWVWGRDPTTTPWYPSVRLFRQRQRGDWNQVIHDVAVALREL